MTLQQFSQSPQAREPHFLVIGRPVGHSLSPLMHNTATKYYALPERYYAVELGEDELSSWAAYLNNETLKGVNITIPYKERMLDYVDILDESCRHIGAVNTIVKKEHTLVGYNTDAYGFIQPLEPYKAAIEGGHAIIFGTGGASKSIVFALKKMDVEEVMLVSRSPGNRVPGSRQEDVRVVSYNEWPAYAEETTLLVNATPLGMEPRLRESPVRDNQLSALEGKICYDIVYKPLQTRFLKQAQQAGAKTIEGLEMLIHQGSRSFELWTGKPFPVDEVRKILYAYFKEIH